MIHIASFLHSVWILCPKKGWRWCPVEVCRVTVSSWRSPLPACVHCRTLFSTLSWALSSKRARPLPSDSSSVYTTGQFDPPRPSTCGWEEDEWKLEGFWVFSSKVILIQFQWHEFNFPEKTNENKVMYLLEEKVVQNIKSTNVIGYMKYGWRVLWFVGPV